MSDPIPARDAYDPVRDLARVLASALRQGYQNAPVRGALRRLAEGLAVDDRTLAWDVEAALRTQLAMGQVDRRAEALANVRYLASLPDAVLREAFLIFRYEQPGKADALWGYLTGAIMGPQVPDEHLGREDEAGPQSACT